MQGALISISDSAVLSPGNPADWEYTSLQNASSYGFASSRNVLSSQKLGSLQALNSSYYDTVRERMGAGRFELSISVVDSGGSTLYSFGKAPDAGNETVSSASAERLALLDDGVVTLKVQLWRRKARLA